VSRPLQFFAFGVGPDEQLPALRDQLAAMVEQVGPWTDTRRMVNFLGPEEATDQRVMREIYGTELYDHLTLIKRDYDPANMFRINHDIEPARA
jgi:Berberine and berberine like